MWVIRKTSFSSYTFIKLFNSLLNTSTHKIKILSLLFENVVIDGSYIPFLAPNTKLVLDVQFFYKNKLNTLLRLIVGGDQIANFGEKIPQVHL